MVFVTVTTKNEARVPTIPDDYAEQVKAAGLPKYWEENQNRDPRYQWMHPFGEVREKPEYTGGCGLFASKLIKKGEKFFHETFNAPTDSVWVGEQADLATIESWPAARQELFLHFCDQYDLDKISCPRICEDGRPEDFQAYINHSCEPNLIYHNGTFNLIARRDIQPGEEVTMDYGSYMTSSTCERQWADGVLCRCGSALCRGRPTRHDHLNPELIQRYGRDWPPHAVENQKKHRVAFQGERAEGA